MQILLHWPKRHLRASLFLHIQITGIKSLLRSCSKRVSRMGQKTNFGFNPCTGLTLIGSNYCFLSYSLESRKATSVPQRGFAGKVLGCLPSQRQEWENWALGPAQAPVPGYLFKLRNKLGACRQRAVQILFAASANIRSRGRIVRLVERHRNTPRLWV